MPNADGAAERAPRDELTRRIHAVEEAYEFMLGYAAQGLTGDAAARSDGQVRELMTAATVALRGIGALVPAIVERLHLESSEKYAAFREVLDADARASLAAFEVVLAQSTISSPLVDNLNASIHLRALLTDLFLLDEILKSGLPGKDGLPGER